MNTDRPVLGIMLMLGFCVLAPFGDAVAKLLGASLPLAQVVMIRFALQAIVLVPLIWITGRVWRTNARVFRLTLLRTILHIIGILPHWLLTPLITCLRHLQYPVPKLPRSSSALACHVDTFAMARSRRILAARSIAIFCARTHTQTYTHTPADMSYQRAVQGIARVGTRAVLHAGVVPFPR